MRSNGIHHVTAIAGRARRNLDFYTRVLGLRLVKKTVNFDDPGTYHFYYGDETGQPGTILTFFPWAHVAPGPPRRRRDRRRRCSGCRKGRSVPGCSASSRRACRTRPSSSASARPCWPSRIRTACAWRLVAVPGIGTEPGWAGGGVPAEHAIRGFHSVSLLLEDTAATGAVLDRRARLHRGRAGRGRGPLPGRRHRDRRHRRSAGGRRALPSRPGAGSVHHIAFRAADDAAQAEMVKRLAENHRLITTEQKDRAYFRSVYFREPGRVLFEIATDIPGFAVDEPAATLGQALKLPRFLEPHRAEIERVLPDVA